MVHLRPKTRAPYELKAEGRPGLAASIALPAVDVAAAAAAAFSDAAG
jgi:hypothetical protein